MSDLENALASLRAGALFDFHKLSLEEAHWSLPVGKDTLTLKAGVVLDESDYTLLSRKYAMLVTATLKRVSKTYTSHKYLPGPLPGVSVCPEYREVAINLIEGIIEQEKT